MSAPLSQRIIETIARAQKRSIDSITAETPFKDLGVDSLDSLEILFALEEEFKVSISDDAAREIKTVGDAIDGITALLAQKAALPPGA